MSALAAPYNESWVVYGFSTVGNPEIRYIGKTINSLAKRIASHKYEARHKPKKKSSKWLRKHLDDLVVHVIERCPPGDAKYLNNAEKYWISFYLEIGHDLMNQTTGGEGTPGRPIPLDERKRHSKRMSGHGNPMYGLKFSENHRKNISNSLKGKTSWAKGKQFSDEHKANISKNHADVSGNNNPMYGVPSPNTGVKFSDDHKDKIRQARTGQNVAPHVRWHVNRGVVSDTCQHCMKGNND